MGIFGVNMPLLYGEGDKAFVRLQEEILKQTADQSILVWRSLSYYDQFNSSILADCPARFRDKVEKGQRDSTRFEIELTPRGMTARVWKCPCRVKVERGDLFEYECRWLAVLDCNLAPDLFERPAILLKRADSSQEAFERDYTGFLVIVRPGGYELLNHAYPSSMCKFSWIQMHSDRWK